MATMATPARVFEDKPAARERTPLLVGLVGPSGGGKTYSALRLASGIQRVCGGEIFVIDTEARRALHYAEAFQFRHVAFGAPFGPLDYLAAIEHCLKRGAKTIVVDSMSHEHEGPGGVLEMHAAELARLGGKQTMTMLAWQKPKSERRRLINSVIQMECNFIFCFRAKEKMRLVKGDDPKPRGWMPLAGEEFVYELTLKCLLLPGANGVPTLAPEHDDERAMVKVPGQFARLFEKPTQISEDLGEALARWAAGPAALPRVTPDDLVKSYEACADAATLRTLKAQRSAVWKACDAPTQARIKAAAEACKARMDAAAEAAARGEGGGDDDGPDGPGGGKRAPAGEGADDPEGDAERRSIEAENAGGGASARAAGPGPKTVAPSPMASDDAWVNALLDARSREACLQLWRHHARSFNRVLRTARAESLARWMVARGFAADGPTALAMLLERAEEAA
jgi:hypothetical protein